MSHTDLYLRNLVRDSLGRIWSLAWKYAGYYFQEFEASVLILMNPADGAFAQDHCDVFRCSIKLDDCLIAQVDDLIRVGARTWADQS